MSTKMLRGTTLRGCLVLALICAMLVFPGNILANPPDASGNHSHGGGGGGGGGSDGAVTVTLQDRPGDRLMSDFFDCPTTGDCLSPYIDGVDGVRAQLDTSGKLAFGGLGKRNKPVIRMLFLDFSECVQGPCNPPFAEGFGFSPAVMFTSGVDLRRMLVGETRNDLGANVTVKPTDADHTWRFFFDPQDRRSPDSTYLSVTRLDTDTWAIEAGPTDVAWLGENLGGGGLTFAGLYHMPFKMIVQAN